MPSQSFVYDSLSESMPTSAWKQKIRRRLLSWYGKQARDLPWRKSSDPYQIWISEVMLQQTQVATVIPYFHRFIKQFPTVGKLAAAPQDKVLRLWEGLGYYRRARQLHKAAQVIVQQHQGRFPRQFDDVLALPGIGRYTAGAILSIALDKRLPILEANSRRVLCRLAGFGDDPTQSQSQKFLWTLAEQLLPRKKVGDFNQSMMELGSEICSLKSPLCSQCPVARLCITNQQGLQGVIPAPAKKTQYEDLREAAVVIRRHGKILLRRCAVGQRWAGLWDFPRFPVAASQGKTLRNELALKVAEMTGLRIETGSRLTTIKHGVTRFRITLLCHEAECQGGRLRIANGTWRWISPKQLNDFPLSVTGRKIGHLLLQNSPKK